MQLSTLSGVLKSSSDLLHDVSYLIFSQTTPLTFSEFTEVHTGAGSLHDQGDIVGCLEPLQELHTIATPRWFAHHLHQCHLRVHLLVSPG